MISIEKGYIASYREGSRFGKALLRKLASELYEVYVKWEDPRDTKTILSMCNILTLVKFI